MASTFDPYFGTIPPAAAAFESLTMDGDEYVRCGKCGFGGCDVRVSVCGCTLHARCTPLSKEGPLLVCPQCSKPTQGLVLFPMSFREIDDARKLDASLADREKNRGRKRKSGDGADDGSSYFADRRTGRWTQQEMNLCDKLMDKFQSGELPLQDGMKLNEFLGCMLKSKQSRLTKKMKNAKLSSKSFARSTGCLSVHDAREFSELEEAFFNAMTEPMERADIKFHMQKEWREQFSRVCAEIKQPLDVDSWLSSVEEMDRRASKAKDAARMAKRKIMMGVALKHDTNNVELGIFIDKTDADTRAMEYALDDHIGEDVLQALVDDKSSPGYGNNAGVMHSAPFLSRVIDYMHRHHVPFEHVDLWVPSFVNHDGGDGTACRLCYAGSATADKIMTPERRYRELTQDESFNMNAFGVYSQKFSFDVGCGLPGRVYESGRPTWEQMVHNAPNTHFERCGGALQWGVKSVLAIPVASPNVGRIVVILYSFFDRNKNEDLVGRLAEECTRLMPSPKWKLVVDIGGEEEQTEAPAPAETNASHQALPLDILDDPTDMKDASGVLETAAPNGADVSNGNLGLGQSHSIRNSSSTFTMDPRLGEVLPLVTASLNDPRNTAHAASLVSLQNCLTRKAPNASEKELITAVLHSFSSYLSSGRDRSEIALLLARDFMFISHPHADPLDPDDSLQPSFLNIGHAMMAQEDVSNAAANFGVPSEARHNPSVFGLPSTNTSVQHSPALAPIPAPGGRDDGMSIISN